jgi:hypothetical protein
MSTVRRKVKERKGKGREIEKAILTAVMYL